jgi:ankyrin repeat protein
MRSRSWFFCGLLAAFPLSAATEDTRLVEAARNDDRPAVQALLAVKATDANAASADGTTALHWAVHNDDTAMVDMLLASGAKVAAANRYGVQPLTLAAENGSAKIIERLLKAGADANTTMPEGETALMTAARAGKVDAIKTLLVHGANVNARDSFRGQTALMWAAARNNADAIRMLVEFGADLKIRTNNAARSADRKSDSGNTFASPPATGFTAFLFAVRAGQIAAVKALLEAGANVNDTVSDGESALMIACANASWELANLLLDKGADPNMAGAGWNALHQAVRERRPNIGFGTPGPISTGNLDSIEVIKKMIAKGAHLDARMTKNGMKDGQRNRLNRLGTTAFFLAAKNTDVEVMKMLLAAGADPSIPSADMTTPLMVASGLMLWNPGEDGGSLPGQEEEVLEAVKICVEHGNDVNATNIYKETALIGAAYRGANLVVQYLADHGAKLDIRDERGWTALTVANGINYSDFFKAQPPTADLLRKLMQERGLSTEGQVADGKECMDCLQTHGEEARAVAERDKKMEAEFNASYHDPAMQTKPSQK